MVALRLRTQLVVATLLIICALTGALLFIVRHTVRSEIDRQVRESTNASLRAFENVQRQRELELSRTAAMLAELPTLKALMTSEDPPTIQDASIPFWKLAGSDLLLLAGPDGRILGFHVIKSGWSPRFVEGELKRSLSRGEGSAWWYSEGQLYWVFLRLISAGSGGNQRPLGLVAVGYQVDSSVAEQLALVAGSNIALAMGNKIIASTLSPTQEAQFSAWIGRHDGRSGRETLPIALASNRYQLASVSLREGTQAPVLCYVLVSLDRATRFIQGLNRTIFVLGISAVIFSALLLGFVSRRITRPLENLVAGVRALASGDYTYSVTPRGSSEVAELSRTFSKMRADLLESQQRRLAAERIAALGRAAGSISHDLRHHLATVVANAEFLYESEKLKLDRHEIYAEIQTASEQMTDLLDSLREMAREGAAITPVLGSMELSIRKAVDSVTARPEWRQASISVNTNGEMEGFFDTRKMERVFFNLLLNACEASAPGQCQIEVEARSSADDFEVRIIDHGGGIPESVRDSLFDPFVSTGKPNGTGMGLAIVKKIMQDHGGSVCVERSSAAGTTFLLKLPRHVPVPNQEIVTAPEEGRPSPHLH
jgi:signal transduction histidine kinase